MNLQTTEHTDLSGRVGESVGAGGLLPLGESLNGRFAVLVLCALLHERRRGDVVVIVPCLRRRKIPASRSIIAACGAAQPKRPSGSVMLRLLDSHLGECRGRLGRARSDVWAEDTPCYKDVGPAA
jgi:hypothetical protein